MMWAVVAEGNGVAHVVPAEDQFEHRIDTDGDCWCGAWKESIEGGVLVHHLDLSERVQLLLPRTTTAMTGADGVTIERGER